MDAEILGKALEHRNINRQLDAVELLLKLTETETPRRTRTIIGQLKLIRDTCDDPELIELATQLIERLE